MLSATLSASGRVPRVGAAKCIPIRRAQAGVVAGYSRRCCQGPPP